VAPLFHLNLGNPCPHGREEFNPALPVRLAAEDRGRDAAADAPDLLAGARLLNY
jgi:hypothetical protein